MCAFHRSGTRKPGVWALSADGSDHRGSHRECSGLVREPCLGFSVLPEAGMSSCVLWSILLLLLKALVVVWALQVVAFAVGFLLSRRSRLSERTAEKQERRNRRVLEVEAENPLPSRTNRGYVRARARTAGSTFRPVMTSTIGPSTARSGRLANRREGRGCRGLDEDTRVVACDEGLRDRALRDAQHRGRRQCSGARPREV